jgi:peptidoglycan-associated lipoprotein
MRRETLIRFSQLIVAVAFLGACGGPQYPNCNNDSNCHAGEFCVNGRCQQCRPGGNDCPPGQQCSDGRCEAIEGWCNSTADCPQGQECQGNRCVAPISEGGGDTTPPRCSLSAAYFDYDSSELEGSARTTLESNAQCIQSRDIPHVRVVGHCDPRGTEEYNLALGDRRARTVQTFMGRLGVDNSRMTTQSMGEEMARGTDDSSWVQDRRVEFEER